jgi:GNAT superfamily N-acetyltransferase
VRAIALAAPAELDEVRAFYARAGYGGTVAEQDVTLVARVDGRLVGVVRLCPESGITVLRGMQVDPAHQRSGLGRRMLAACRPWLERGPACCLPYEHLIPFYALAGFEVASPAQLPEFLAERLARYRAAGQRVLAMHRRPDPAPGRA